MTATTDHKRQCLERKLGPELVRLMSLEPSPPDIRGHILAKTHCWIPDEITDLWAYLLEWNPPDVEVPVDQPQATPVEGVGRAIYELSASRTQTVFGRANFSATELQSASDQLTAEEIADIIDGADDREDAEQRLRDYVQEWDYCCDSTEGYDYADEEPEEYGDADDYDDNVRSILAQFYRDHPEYDPEREEDEDGEEDEGPANAIPFRIGQRVRVIGRESGITFTGETGTVRYYNQAYNSPELDYQCVAVEFDTRFNGLLHDCVVGGGSIVSGLGYWVRAASIQAVTD